MGWLDKLLGRNKQEAPPPAPEPVRERVDSPSAPASAAPEAPAEPAPDEDAGAPPPP